MTMRTRTTLAESFRRAALPLAAYYGVTLALPIINGAAESGAAFATHALVVLAVPPLLIALAYAAMRATHAVARLVRSALPVERSRARLRQRALTQSLRNDRC